MKVVDSMLVAAAACAAFAWPAAAQQQFAAANSLEELLRQVEGVRSEEQQQFEQRVNEYNSSQARQQQMLNEAQQRRQQLDTQSQRLQEQYETNELRINELNNELRMKADQLGLSQVFGLARQVANDVASTLRQSLISTQFPVPAGDVPRDEFLRVFAESRQTPTADDLERVWFEIQREMTASGEVARYRAPVVQPAGQVAEANVVRIGPFNATSDGQFLSYLPSLRALNVLPRQLDREFLEIAERFESTTSGYAEAVVDFNRGVTIGMYVERPTIVERIELGEEVGYVIIAVGLAGALAFLFQLVYLVIVRMAVSRQLKNLDRATADNPLGRVLLAFKGDKDHIEEDADVAELRITEAVLREVPKLERFQAFLRLSVAAGPLLGLIGTVVGMIITFQSITETGSSDPRLMATGIGQAMIATVLGLGIAIPLLFAGALLNSLSRGIVQVLDEQSAGMLAESIEKQRRA